MCADATLRSLKRRNPFGCSLELYRFISLVLVGLVVFHVGVSLSFTTLHWRLMRSPASSFDDDEAQAREQPGLSLAVSEQGV